MDLGLGQNGHGGLTQDVCPTLSPNPSPSRERGTSDPIEMIAEGKYSIEAVCIESDMSILELAAHVCTAQNLETLARVKLLHATEREMLLGKLKRDALVRLAELTDEVPAGSADEIRAFEVMRKACADLLRYGGLNTEKRHSEPGGPRARGYHPEPLTPAFEAEVLDAWERMGEVLEKAEGEGGVGKSRTGKMPVPPLKEADTRTRTRRVPPPEIEINHTRTRRVPPAPPHDGSMGQGQSGHCPCCPAGGTEEHVGVGTKHGSVSLDDAHPP